MNRAYSLLKIKSVSEDERVIVGMATTPTPDRSGDIVEPKGAEFKLPIPLLWQHNAREPIGHVLDAKVTNDGIEVTAQISKFDEPGTLKNRLDEAWQSIKSGLVGGLSIGFTPIEEARIKDSYSFHILKWLWLELSAVTIPANGQATITAIKSIDTQERAALGRNALPIVRLSSSPGVAGRTVASRSGTKPTTSSKEIKYMPRNVAEQITALEATKASKAARMAEVLESASDEDRSSNAAESEEFDTLESEIKAIDNDLKRYRALERLNASTAKEVGSPNTPEEGTRVRAGVQIKKEKPKYEKGIEFAQYAICLAAGRGNLLQSFEIAKNRFAQNEDLVEIMKAAVNAGTTTDPNWGGNLVESYPRFAGDFVEFLRPKTIIGQFGTNGIPGFRMIPFNVSIAGQASGGTGYWVGDGAAKPLTRFDFNVTNLRWAKVANIAVITEELLRFSNPSADALVRDALAGALIERLDIDLLDPNKAEVTNVSPASLSYGVSAINSTGNSADDVRTDVSAVLTTYIAANVSPTTAVWVMSARRALSLSLMRNALGQREFPDISMMGGRLEGLPVIVSEYVHSDSDGDSVFLINASDVWLADDGQVMLDASRETSLQMSDAPTLDASQGTGASMVSMFQTNSVALRAERFINWKKRRASALVHLNAVNWGLDSGT